MKNKAQKKEHTIEIEADYRIMAYVNKVSTHGFILNFIVRVVINHIFHNLSIHWFFANVIILYLFFANVIIMGMSMNSLIVSQRTIIVLGIERERLAIL